MAGSKGALPLACFLAFLCLSTVSASAAPKSDFNVLTLLWPGAKCNSLLLWCWCCRPTPDEQPKADFFVEALETYSSITGKPVTNCNSTCPFYVNQLKNLIEDLNYYWPDVSCPSNNGKKNWQSKWCTYGLCSNLAQTDYFQRALQLRAKLDPLFVLQEFDIVPSSSKLYNLEDIENALLPSFGFSFYIECNTKLFIESQLYKIHFCVSADAKRLITCTIPRKSNCNAKVRFVPFTDDMLCGVNANPIRMPSAGDVAM